MYRGLFGCVGLPILTSDGLAGLLQWRCISPVIKAHKSTPIGFLFDALLLFLANASLNVCKSESDVIFVVVAAIGVGDIFVGLGDNLQQLNH